MIYVRARNAAEKLELLEDTSKSPIEWIVTRNGQVCSVGSESSAKSQYSWLELLPRVKENAVAEEEEEKLRRQVAAWLAPKPGPDPGPDFEM